MFDIKQFSSGEYDVKINQRLCGHKVIISWNWFDESQRDIFQLLLKINAVKINYPEAIIEVHANYLPYMRQDRIFEVGHGIPSNTLLNLLNEFVNIKTMGIHSGSNRAHSQRYELYYLEGYLTYEPPKPIFKKYNLVFPDVNAKNHFIVNDRDFLSYKKQRNDTGIELVLDNVLQKTHREFPFLICDDICAGGRTFIECANALQGTYGNNIQIELLIYHAFLDRGIDGLKRSGVSKIHIINPDSYEYILKEFPKDHDYFNYINIQG